MPRSQPADVIKKDSAAIPMHVGIIMDGNHRWAQRRHIPGAAGHRAGARRLREIAEACADAGVKNLTLFAFSTENWARPRKEVSLLMDLMRHVLENDIDELNQRGVRIRVIGDRTRLAPDLQAKMAQCESLTSDNTALNLSVAVNAEKVAIGALSVEDIDESDFSAGLSLAGLPDPDLLIRTGGEVRVSNFLLWDLAYTELYFTETLWPDFDAKALDQAIGEFSNRARRFGNRG